MSSERAAVAPAHNPDDLRLMTAARNYRAWVFRAFGAHVGSRVVDVGAGIGNYSEFLMDREHVVLVDSSPALCAMLRQRFAGRHGVRVAQFDLSTGDVAELGAGGFDTVLCLDVLEHLRDDGRAVSQLRRLLAPGGRLILKVPALRALYGTIDRALGHHRRYRRAELLDLLTAAGFAVERCFYFNFAGALAWWINAHVLRRRNQSVAQVWLFDRALVPVISRLEARWPPPWGQSLVVIGRAERSEAGT